MMGLTPDDCDGALQFLEETCDAIAAAKAELERSAILAKRTRKRIFVTAEGSVAQREAVAETHVDVISADCRHVEAISEFSAQGQTRSADDQSRCLPNTGSISSCCKQMTKLEQLRIE